MNIIESIKITFHEHPSPRICELDVLSSKYRLYTNRIGIFFVETFSTSFFPKLIKNRKSNEICLLWDNHFWDLYERYLLFIAKIEKNEIRPHIAFDFFMALYMLFLASRFYDNSELSLVFAKHYASTGFFIPPYYMDNNVRPNLGLNGYMECAVYSKDFIFFHEIMHARYKNDANEKKHDFDMIRNLCEKMKVSELPIETKEAIMNLLVMQDESILEELCCDVNSICTIILLYSRNNCEGYNKKIAEDVIKAIRLITLFINSLKKADVVYKKRCETNNMGEIQDYIMGENYVEIEARNYIVFFLAITLMGLSGSDMHTGHDFIVRDDLFDMFFRPTDHVLSFDFIEGIFNEAKFYSNIFTSDQCKNARDIFIGWHKAI